MAEKKTEKTAKKNSLQAKVLQAVLMGSLLLGIVTLLVGLSSYTYSLIEQYTSRAFGLSVTAAQMIRNIINIDSVESDVMTIYNSLNEEERQKNQTDEYAEMFFSVYDNIEFVKLLELLDSLNSNNEVSNIYVGVMDERTKSLVYICNPDKRAEVYRTGEWEPVDDEVIRKFINWTGQGSLYYIKKSESYGYTCTSGFPLTFDEYPTLFIMVDVTMNTLMSGARRFVVSYALALFIVVLFLGWIMSRRMNRTLVEPINRIAGAAKAYVKDRREGFTGNDHFSSLQIRTGDEIENLSHVMSDMEAGMSEYERDLTAATAESERLVTQLTLAEKIQEESLPKNFDDFRNRPEFALYAKMDPAMEVGGDFYDFYMLDDDHLVLTIADVSGKGIPAALFMMASMIKIADYVRLGRPLAEVMETANNDFCAQNGGEMFVTVWTAVLELSTGILKAVNAGHEYPAIKNPDGQFELYKDRHGFVIGGMSGMKYKEYELQLKPGSVIFVYTDGVPESSNVNNELFGTERMLQALNAHPDAAPEQLLENVHKAADDFAGEAPQFDDLTMLCVRYFGPAGKQDRTDTENTEVI